MKEIKAPDKIVQAMTRDGAVEVNKATGGAERISAREIDVSPGDSGAGIIGGVADRVLMERRAHKKKAARKANRKIYKQVQRKPETSRLMFTDAERGDPSLAKSIKKSDKAANRYEKARARIPKEKVLSIERVTDAPKGKRKPEAMRPVFSDKGRLTDIQRVKGEPTGKPATRLTFRERDKPPNGKLTHVLDRPGREAAHAVHSEFSQSDNVGAQSAGATGRAAATAARKAGELHSCLKFAPQRKLLKAEDKAVKSNVKALYKRDLRMKPELEKANVFRKAAYKRKLKKDYSRAFRTGNFERVKKNAKKAANTAKKAGDAVQQTVKFAAKNWKLFAVCGGLLFFVILLAAGISSCASMFGGGGMGVIATSYTAEDADIIGADNDYTALESGLRQRISRIETDYPGYDEYRFSLDEIGHDPFELASYLTAKFNMYTRAEVQAELAALFAQQYTLTLTPVTEVRYRTETRTGTSSWTDADGNTHTETYTYEVQVPYNYYILNVSLTNRSLGSVALSNLTPEQAEMYAVYMETKGNKPELFADNVYVNRGEYTDYDIPPDALNDVKFAVMIQEAEKYLGYPYVWGGSSPSTSFDCSGFVSWVINQSGVGSVGRMTASGLMNHCAIIPPSEAKPGDLIFFQGTYDTSGASHVGIYVGGGMMIHCGNPISYASVTTTYWTNHFYAYGRLP
jgi:cell wall-associated NlpC family hydrolase